MHSGKRTRPECTVHRLTHARTHTRTQTRTRFLTHRQTLLSLQCSSSEERPGTQSVRFPAPAQGLLSKGQPSGRWALETSSSGAAVSLLPTHAVSATRDERTRCSATPRAAKVFVPPFKMKSQLHRDEHCNSKNMNSERKNQKSRDGESEDVRDSDVRQFNRGSFPQEATRPLTERAEEPLGIEWHLFDLGFVLSFSILASVCVQVQEPQRPCGGQRTAVGSWSLLRCAFWGLNSGRLASASPVLTF